MTQAPELNRSDMLDVFLRELKGADRVVVQTKNALGEYDAYYLHAPAILEAWNTRAASPAQQMREALEEIAKQKKTTELETEYDVEVADFETGYDMYIDRARAALRAIAQERDQ